jgi:chromosome segregation ATPase
VRSRRVDVLRRLHFIGMNRLHERMVYFSSLRRFGSRRGRRGVSRVDGVSATSRRRDAVFMITRESTRLAPRRCKALSEEIETPLNIHRWRQLEGSDPAQLEMIQKVQTLQKRLIQKTEEVVERDLSLQEKERLYNELKAILARQPGPEVAEQLSVYQSSLRGKTRQMKSMASELNMYQAQLSEYKYEVERLTRELQDAKRKYYESKRRDQLARELDAEERDLGALQAQTQLAASQSAKTRFTGGGFAIR